MERNKNGFRIEYFLMIIVSFFWAVGHPLGSIILKKIHPFQLGALTSEHWVYRLDNLFGYFGKAKKNN